MKTQNHESFFTCTNCGHEYNFYDWGYYCPNCLGHNKPATARRPLLFALCPLLFALCSLPFALCAQQPPALCPLPFAQSYLITIKTGKTTQVFKHTNQTTADSLTTIYTGKTTAQLLSNSKFYEHRNKSTWFYIEQKKTRKKKQPTSNQQQLTFIK